MTRKAGLIPALAAAAAVLSSCLNLKNENIVAYDYITIGSISQSVFRGDGGEIIDIVENQTTSTLDEQKRVVAKFDVLDEVTGSENRFTGRLKSFTVPLMKDCVKRSAADENIGKDPIGFHQPWISGGYLNFLFSYPFQANSGVLHDVNLVVEKESAARDTLYLYLSHNAGGETFDNASGNLQLGSSYASFTVKEMEEHSYKALCFEWDWYETDVYGNPYTNEPRHYKESMILEDSEK